MNNKEYKMLLSSKKLTFSLASLIVVMLALGFAFWTTPVLAHPHDDDTNTAIPANPDNHKETDHPIATITLTSANGMGFDGTTIVGTSVRLVNAAVVADTNGDGTEDDATPIGGRFVVTSDPVTADPSATPPVVGITRDDGLFKLNITFSTPITINTFASTDILLTVITMDGTRAIYDISSSAGNWTIGTPVPVNADLTATPADTDDTAFTVDITIPASNYPNLPLIVYASVPKAGTTIGTTTFDGVTSAEKVSDEKGRVGDRIPALANRGSKPGDAEFLVFATALLPSDAPKNFAVVAGDAQVTLTFGLVTDATGYQYRKGSGDWMDIPAGSVETSGVSHIVTGLTNGTEATFQVRAISGPQMGMATTSMAATPLFPAPAKPGNFVVVAGDAQVTLTFDLVADATGYQYMQANGEWMDIPAGSVGASGVSHVVTGLTNDVQVSFKVRAVRTNAQDGTQSDSIDGTPVGPDNEKPTVRVISPTAPEDDKLNFAYTVSDTTGKDVLLTEGEVDVENGDVDSITATHIIVVPDSDTSKVTVTVKKNALTDAANNKSEASTPVSFTPTGYTPTITITPTDGTGDDEGKIIFTIDFSEAVASFDVSNIDATNAPLLRITDLMEVEGTADAPLPEGVAKRYELTIDPVDDTKAVQVTIRAGAVRTMDGSHPFDSAQEFHTLEQPPTAATITTTDLGNRTAGATLTVTFSKDPGTVMAAGTELDGTGPTRMITAAATAGSHSVALTWDNGGSGTVTYTIPAAEANTSGDITIGAGGFVVVVRDTSGALATRLRNRFGANNITLVSWMTMPDLQNIFETGVPLTGPAHGGGALILRQSGTTAVHPGTVGISEIMWAIDLSQLNDATARSADQWIELHNLNTAAVTVKLSWKTGAKAIAADDNINGDLAAPYLDVVTNVFHDRAYDRHGPWVLPGQNGNPLSGVNFVSAARKGTFDLNSANGGKRNKRYTRTDKPANPEKSNSFDGRNKDQWEASTVRYDLRSQSITVGNRITIVTYEDYGTPGRPNNFSPERAPVKDARTDINPAGIIINEVANRDEEQNQYEWIELRNVSDAEINLNNYLISILTGVGKDQHFIILPNNNNAKIPAGGVLLLVDSDPFGDPDHPLAVGWNVDKNAEDQVPGLKSLGISATSKHGRYKVVQFGQTGEFEDGLPDDGNFILVVRKPDNHEVHHGDPNKGRADLPTDKNSGDRDLDKIVDIAGYAPGLNTGLGYKNAISETSLWPLKSQGAPDDKNRLSENKVRERQHVSTRNGRAGTGNTHDNRNPGDIAFRDIGYTGIGYKRQAPNSSIHGGTPGYDNGARKGKVTDLAMKKLVISEIMLSQGPEDARTTLPQWIEIYNPSSHPVGLGGWKLIIENPRDPIRTINLGGGTVKTILSKQTILVVSGSARDIGSDTLPSATLFPATRVYNVYQHQKNEFNMTSRFDPILDEEAFHITLIDGTAIDTSKVTPTADHMRVGGNYYAISDAVGNLDGDPRTNDTPEDNGKMKFEKGMTEDGDRTSIIRVFDDRVARDGISGDARDGTGAVKPLGGTNGVGVARMKGIDSQYSWVHAVDTKQRLVRHTWYGDESDWGTPLDRGGQILPVELSHFRPTLEDGKVTIRWTTESELDNAGFNILRSEARDGEFKQVNTEMIQGHGTTGERHTYKWVDQTAKPNVVYYYQIEDVSFAGERQTLQTTKLKGLISARGKATTTWGDIKEVQ
jgi:hypothetical protein